MRREVMIRAGLLCCSGRASCCRAACWVMYCRVKVVPEMWWFCRCRGLLVGYQCAGEVVGDKMSGSCKSGGKWFLPGFDMAYKLMMRLRSLWPHPVIKCSISNVSDVKPPYSCSPKSAAPASNVLYASLFHHPPGTACALYISLCDYAFTYRRAL